MLETVAATRSATADFAAGFEPCTLTHDQAVQLVHDVGAIHRLAEAVLARAVKRVADTAGCRKGAERDAAQLYARAVGVATSEARRAMTTAKCLERLPETDAAVREGGSPRGRRSSSPKRRSTIRRRSPS
jgi:hypothetical protein